MIVSLKPDPDLFVQHRVISDCQLPADLKSAKPVHYFQFAISDIPTLVDKRFNAALNISYVSDFHLPTRVLSYRQLAFGNTFTQSLP
jgi:hypothetical protein